MDFDLFKNNYISNFKNYEISYRYFEEGDFGTLNQVVFESNKQGGEIDFWSSGRISIFIWNYVEEKEAFNVLLLF